MLKSLVAMLVGSCVAAIATPAAAQDCMQWRLATPGALRSAAMCYDSHRHKIMLFGGSSWSGDTWVWHDDEWHLAATVGPTPRLFPAMCYDSKRDKVVLFGGTDANGAYGDTWEWDGTSWSLRATTGPSPRRSHTLAFDSARGVSVLVGGQPNPNETWEWNGETWTLRSSTGPFAVLHAMTYDPIRKRTVVYGGIALPNQTWEWDGDVWVQFSAAIPQMRLYAAMAYDVDHEVSVLYGGNTNTNLWEWDGQSWKAGEALPQVGELRNHCMAYDESAHEMLMAFGGEISRGSKTWSGTGGIWTLKSVGSTGEDADHLFLCGDANALVLHGRFYTAGIQTWIWNGKSWKNCDCPIVHDEHYFTMGFDSDDSVAVLHSKKDCDEAVTWEWASENQSWEVHSHEGPTVTGVMAYDRSRHVMVLFGSDYCKYESDAQTWEWDGTSWHQRNVTNPTPGPDPLMTFDSRRNVTVLHGSSTWEWNGIAWHQAAISGPAVYGSSSMFFDTVRGVTVLIQPASDTTWLIWHWNGKDWRKRELTNASSSYDFGIIAYDTARDLYLRSIFNSTLYVKPPKLGDLNCDDLVNVADLIGVLNAWGNCPPAPTYCDADVGPLGGDGAVDMTDLLFVLDHWES